MSLSLGFLVKRPTFWLGLLLTVVAFSVLINLGLWQLSRANEKLEIEQYLSEREFSQPISLSQVGMGKQTYVTGLKVKAELVPEAGRYVLLDNQTFQGEVGYLAYQLMASREGKWLLLERGFIGAGSRRDVLPKVHWLTHPLTVTGRLYQRSSNPLSDQLYAEAGEVTRIQNLNIDQLAKEWQRELEPYVIQPQMEDWSYPQPWQPVPLSSSKHIGYAVQWFSMAAVLGVLSIWVLVRALKKGESHE
tara:strand:- start:313 stop:1053 length:741 start_codon:yes stop_codon:yes gene_type:complete